jgi:hypothetical protein
MHPVAQDMYVFHSDESKMAGGNVGWCVCDWQKAGTGGNDDRWFAVLQYSFENIN